MDVNYLISAGSSAVICTLLLQWMKRSTLIPFLGVAKNFEKTNLIISIIVSGIASLGIGYTFNDQTGDLVIHGLTTANVVHNFGHWVSQWIAQHVAYKTVIVPGELLEQLVSSSTEK